MPPSSSSAGKGGRGGGRAWGGAAMAVKLAVVVRTDLDMGRGKIAAQVAHAAVAATLASLGTADVAAWLREGQPKVVLKVSTAGQLEDVVRQGRESGLPVEAISDAGRTQLTPGTLTCCALGPAESHRIDAVTGGLPLL
jgi:PTH2 family peptidyl-tRNA hydrolase